MPIRKKDGTGIQSFRLKNGTGIQEIRKGDGTVLFSAYTVPESAVYQWDARELPTGSLTEWTDEIAGEKLLTQTGSPQVVDNGVNGNRSVRFDGDRMQTETNISVPQSHTVMLIVETFDSNNDDRFIDGEAQSYIIRERESDYYLWSGSSNLTASNGTAKAYMFTAVFDGSSDQIIIDTVSQATGNTGGNGIEGFHLGGQSSDAQFVDGDIAFVEIHDEGYTQQVQDREQQLYDTFFSDSGSWTTLESLPEARRHGGVSST